MTSSLEPNRDASTPQATGTKGVVPRGRTARWGAGLTLALGLGVLAVLMQSTPAPKTAPERLEAQASVGANRDAGTAAPISRELHGDQQLEGSVRDDLGNPLESALVRVSSAVEPELKSRETQTDGAGKFRIADLPRQLLTLEASAVGHDTVEHSVRSDEASSLALVLPRQGEVLVVLRETPGQSLVGAEVWLTGSGLWPAASGRVDAQGNCLFVALPGGQYQARARHQARVALPSEPIDVTPGKRARIELALGDGASLLGSVFDQDSGKPLPGARVSVLDLTPGLAPLSTQTAPSGSFGFVGLWPSTVRVEAAADGYATEVLDLRLPSKEAINLGLRGSVALAGRVVDERGVALSGALLSVTSRDGRPVSAASPTAVGVSAGELGVTQGPVPRIPLVPEQSFALGTLAARSDAQGAFRIEGLKPGDVVLRASSRGFASAVLPLEDLPPHTARTDLNVMLREAGRIEGRVVDARGRGVGGIYVAALQGEQVEQSSMSDQNGEFTLPDLLGDVSVQIQPEGRDPLACSLQVRARTTARCDVSIASELYELPVRVLDDYGFGLEGAVVSVRAASGKRSFSQVSRDDGRVIIRELPEPPYTLSVELAGHLALSDEVVTHAEREVRVTLRKACRLAGNVVDSSGRPVPGAFVSAEEGDTSAETDGQGAFLLAQVPPGAWILWAAHHDVGEGRSEEVRARPGELRDGIRIVLPGRYSGERGSSRDHAEGRPPSGPHVSETAESARPTPTVAPDKPVDLGLEQRPTAVVVSSVGKNGAAARAGLRAGDVIAAIDGEDVLSLAQARGMLRDPANTTARVRVLRSRQAINVRYRRPGL